RVAFVPFFVVGWLTSGGNTPHYTAADQKWTNWAHDNQSKGRISAFAMLLAGFIFLYFMATIRSVLESAEAPVRGSAQLAHFGRTFPGRRDGLCRFPDGRGTADPVERRLCALDRHRGADRRGLVPHHVPDSHQQQGQR